ncbi:hypothetical protein [Methanoculleus sp. 7T]|uniref:hypothetical protein n=1 Tax=Methanoculleus sp. 7T TaxID=2937282 RepID=UPI0020BE3AAE|nr:hypothetical protein [Methanoculleus sp. 7T]MCK8518548.1 hypothetical protein [Methanoculleus sp. 7T]
MDLKAGLKLPKIKIDRKDALVAVTAAVAVISILLCGWTIFIDYTETSRVAAFGNHVAASEADLFLLSDDIAVHMRSHPDHPSIAECDAYMQELAALADRGRAVTAYHRQVIAADEVPEAYTAAQSAYTRALDHLNRAFSLWSSAAAAYDAKAYSAAKENLAGADRAWRDYVAAIGDYDRELRIAEEGGEAPPA